MTHQMTIGGYFLRLVKDHMRGGAGLPDHTHMLVLCQSIENLTLSIPKMYCASNAIIKAYMYIIYYIMCSLAISYMYVIEKYTVW